MSQENVEILRGILGEMARGNFWALAPYLDADVEWIWAPEFQGIVGEKIFRGPEGVEAATREFFEPWERYTLEAEEFIDAGDSVVVVTHGRGRSKRGGPDVEHRTATVWTLRDRKVVRMTGYDDLAEALKAAGLSEQGAHHVTPRPVAQPAVSRANSLAPTPFPRIAWGDPAGCGGEKEFLMKRRIRLAIAGVTATLLLAIPSAASAQPPVRESASFTFSDFIQCDGFQDQFTDFFNAKAATYFDSAGTPIRIIIHWEHHSNDTNSVTGLTLHEHGHFTETDDLLTGTATITGNQEIINRPGTGVVVQDVGRVVFDADFNILFFAGGRKHSQTLLGEQVLCDALA